MVFDLWDTGSGNLVGDFDTEEAAFAAIRSLLAANGNDFAVDLSLGVQRDDGTSGVIAEGLELGRRARASFRAA